MMSPVPLTVATPSFTCHPALPLSSFCHCDKSVPSKSTMASAGGGPGLTTRGSSSAAPAKVRPSAGKTARDFRSVIANFMTLQISDGNRLTNKEPNSHLRQLKENARGMNALRAAFAAAPTNVAHGEAAGCGQAAADLFFAERDGGRQVWRQGVAGRAGFTQAFAEDAHLRDGNQRRHHRFFQQPTQGVV